MLIDTHTHIYADAFDEDRDEAIVRAIAAGVSQLILPAIDSKTTAIMHEVKRNYPQYVSLMMGLHPTHLFPTAQRRLYHSLTTWTLRDLNFCTVVGGYASVLKRGIAFCTTGINCHITLITSICCHNKIFFL